MVGLPGVLGLLPLGLRVDPYMGYRFTVEIESLIVGGFSEVSGLQSEVLLEDVVEGGQNMYIERLPQRMKYPNLVLKHGLTDIETLWRWHRDIVQGKMKRRNGSIVLFNTNFLEAWRWNFVDAYPVKWTGPTLNAGQSQVAVESVELCHRGLTKGIGGDLGDALSSVTGALGLG
jgi:phage tail-like protein